ncbi:tetratricopeptide repeat protein [Marinibaculum pumilum]|uniref:Tetratricopeptide repeat protein n=1 Tax=Marinibaculum pumilum TaxID=1766165 RepID=A0ABV7KZ32_9PROT
MRQPPIPSRRPVAAPSARRAFAVLGLSLAFALALLFGQGMAPAPASAMGNDNNSSSGGQAMAADPDFTAGQKAIEMKDWQAAIDALTAYVRREPNSADAFNYLGYAQRNLGNYDAAFAAYGQALKIDPDHKGAHEYVGEAYLQTGNLAKAEEHLSKLDELCLFGCAEYTALKEAVAAYKAKNS